MTQSSRGMMTAAPENNPALMFYGAGVASVVPEYEDADEETVYLPGELHPSLLGLMRFPDQPSASVSMAETFLKMESLRSALGLSPADAAICAVFAMTSWFCGCLGVVPTLFVSAFDTFQANELFRLLGAMCRRAIEVTGLTRQAFLDLSDGLEPTLLIMHSNLPSNLRSLLSESSFDGLLVPGRRGGLIRANNSKAIFLGRDLAPPGGRGDLQIVLPQVINVEWRLQRIGG